MSEVGSSDRRLRDDSGDHKEEENRSTSALAVASVESLVVSGIFLPSFFAASSIVERFSGVTAWALYSQGLITVLSSLLVILWISTNKKSDSIAAAPHKKNDDEDEYEEDDDDITKAIAGVDYLSVIGNTQCSAVFLVFAYYFVFFMNSVPYRDLIDDTKYYYEVSDVNGTISRSYEASERLNWIQAALGSSGWELRGATNHVASTSNVPITGQVYMGVTIAYLFVSLLLSVYVAYAGTPYGSYSPLFMDCRSLAATNIFIIFGTPRMVVAAFSECGGEGEGFFSYFTSDYGDLLVLGMIAVVFLEEYVVVSPLMFLADAVLTSCGKSTWGNSKRVLYDEGLLQPLILTFMALSPTGYIILFKPSVVFEGNETNITMTIVYTVSSIVLGSLSVFSCWSSFISLSLSSSSRRRRRRRTSEKINETIQTAHTVQTPQHAPGNTVVEAIGLPPNAEKPATEKTPQPSEKQQQAGRSTEEKRNSVTENKRSPASERGGGDDESRVDKSSPAAAAAMMVMMGNNINNSSRKKEISFFSLAAGSRAAAEFLGARGAVMLEDPSSDSSMRNSSNYHHRQSSVVRDNNNRENNNSSSKPKRYVA